MDGTTFRQPLPEALTTNLATGYSYVDGELEAAPFAYAVMAPASAVTLTPIDMAAFMIAHLHDGEVRNVRILETTTAQEMHRQQFTHHPDMPGMTYGFKERTINGLRVIGHGGDIHTFSSQMVLIPEEDLGFFVVYDRFDDPFREQLISAFFDHYYPAPGEDPTGRRDVFRESGALCGQLPVGQVSAQYAWQGDRPGTWPLTGRDTGEPRHKPLAVVFWCRCRVALRAGRAARVQKSRGWTPIAGWAPG